MPGTVPDLSAGETTGVLADVLAPLLARGIIVRRPRVVGALGRLDAARRAVRRLQRVRARHGGGPVRLGLPVRDVALILSGDDVRRVLDGSPEPFAIANREKRAALERFQPHGVLVSPGDERAERRRFNEEVLETGRPAHGLAGAFRTAVADEIDGLAADARHAGRLDWDAFAVRWWRIVRRVVFGERAAEDDATTGLLRRLRAQANWSFLAPRRPRLERAFAERLDALLGAAPEGTLGHLVRTTPAPAGTFPDGQVPQWLFAFDAAGMATFRALALIGTRPGPHDASLLRAAVLESIRLWPTTPAVLRDTTEVTEWRNGTLPAGAAIVIFAPFFHRDGTRLPFADTFAPELWQDGGDPGDWPLLPFSQGPGECPGRDLVLLLGSSVLARLQSALPVGPSRPALAGRLPATLSPFALRFDVG